eukprot:ANDGO_03664.mRNA.1 hypothetical protein
MADEFNVFMRTLVMEGHEATVTSLSFCPSNRNLLASCSLDRTIRCFDLAARNEQSCVKDPIDGIAALLWIPHSKIIASVSTAGTIRLSLPEGKVVSLFKFECAAKIVGIAASASGDFLLCASENGRICVLATQGLVAKVELTVSCNVSSIAIVDSLLLIGRADGRVDAYCPNFEIPSLGQQVSQRLGSQVCAIRGICKGPATDTVLISGEDGLLSVFKYSTLQDGKPNLEFASLLPSLSESGGEPICVDISAKRSLVAVASDKPSVCVLIQKQDPKESWEVYSHELSFVCTVCAWHATKDVLAVAGGEVTPPDSTSTGYQRPSRKGPQFPVFVYGFRGTTLPR